MSGEMGFNRTPCMGLGDISLTETPSGSSGVSNIGVPILAEYGDGPAASVSVMLRPLPT